jgi:hypothetical protein
MITNNIMNRSKIESTRQTVNGLCKLARNLGYHDPNQQMINSDGSCVGDLLQFFEDNPGACEKVIQWAADNLSDDEHDCDEAGCFEDSEEDDE